MLALKHSVLSQDYFQLWPNKLYDIPRVQLLEWQERCTHLHVPLYHYHSIRPTCIIVSGLHVSRLHVSLYQRYMCHSIRATCISVSGPGVTVPGLHVSLYQVSLYQGYLYHCVRAICMTISGLYISPYQGYMHHCIRSTCISVSGLHVPLYQVYMYHWIKSTCITESGLHVSLNQGYMYHWIRSTCITESGLHLPLHQVYMCCCFRYKTCNDFSTQIFNCWDRGCRGVKLWLNCWMGEKKKKRFDKVCTKGKNCWVTQALVLARFSPISWSEDLFFFCNCF